MKTAYEMRISDWSSDVCSSDLWSTDHLDTRALPPLPSECRRSRHHMGDKAKRGRPPVATPPIHSNHSIGILDRREMAARCHPLVRSEERRVGKECVSTCRSGWSPYHQKKKNIEPTDNRLFQHKHNKNN